jgi:hypothetical protein
VRIVALKDAVTVVVEAERNAMGGDHGVPGAKIAERVLGFELEVGGQDLAGSIILKGHESELGGAAFPPILAAGVGECHHSPPRARHTTGTILARPAFLGRRQFRPAQDAAHGLTADYQVLLHLKFFAEVGIVEASLLAPSQVQDQLRLGNR